MGAELLKEEAPTQEQTNTEVFERCFPFYLAIGMTPAEYWEGDANLALYYRRAYRIKQEQMNNEFWLQGMYVYDAVSTALHNALRGMGKNKPPARDYAKQPYDIFKKEKTPQEKALEVKKEQEKAFLWMEGLVKSHRATRTK